MPQVEIQIGQIVKAVRKDNPDKFRIGEVVNVTDKAVSLLSSHKDEPQNWLVSRNDFYILYAGDIA